MTKTNILQANYTSFLNGYQLTLPLNIGYMIPSNDPVRLLSQFIEGMDLSELYMTYSRISRENQASPRKLLKIMIYAYMNRIYSSRSIESACKRDINFMFLLEGCPVPDHATFARFRTLHFAPCAVNIMAQVTNFLFEIGEISGEAIFIDGTKIEAKANKYTFVWKKAITKNMRKLLDKIADFVAECEQLYDIKIVHNNIVQMRHVKKLRKKLYSIKKAENIEFVHGKGKRKNALQRSIETLEDYLKKLKEYTTKIHTCGKRNSYSKTDIDATFMRMKEDAMKNGQLKPAYNLQHGVDSEYITWLTIGPQPTDTTTLIPFLESMQEHLNFKYLKIVADSGYESEENYGFIESNGQLSYIKPANYEISKTRKYKNDISKAENMIYNYDGDYYVCKNNKKLYATNTLTRKSKTEYKSLKTVYVCKECNNCKFKKDCIKGHNCKTPLEDRSKKLEVSKKFNCQRKSDLQRITSEEGCILRMNRSIQAEGSFASIKQDMGFRRFLCSGTENILAESILLAFAHNINKLHNKIQSKRTGTYLFKLTRTA
ncbi:IS1182 family transposase [Clostridium sp. SM-530-WT-3G]|uniref:IS1182 family transposase n=1 Tax=Clostridium sp. SM-530-WT-3G TaxID=2725303 RepID=UPI00145DC4B1|nr:IS1182 family transposase [Clostridium sp. SM-530-WT-3G]NME83765.1 IS1182 family transposase [Clostridium sp. SM-530-WT-3G]